jgi:hypothetical protein
MRPTDVIEIWNRDNKGNLREVAGSLQWKTLLHYADTSAKHWIIRTGIALPDYIYMVITDNPY